MQMLDTIQVCAKQISSTETCLYDQSLAKSRNCTRVGDLEIRTVFC